MLAFVDALFLEIQVSYDVGAGILKLNKDFYCITFHHTGHHLN